MIFLNSIIDVPDLVARLYLGLDGEKRKARDVWVEECYCGVFPSKEDYTRAYFRNYGSQEDSELDAQTLTNDLFENQVMAVRESDRATHVFIRPEVLEDTSQ